MVSSPDVEQRLASVALDDAKLSDIRGGFDAGSGVTLNFAFQQATFVNHNLTENVVVPTLTISAGQGSVSASPACDGRCCAPERQRRFAGRPRNIRRTVDDRGGGDQLGHGRREWCGANASERVDGGAPGFGQQWALPPSSAPASGNGGVTSTITNTANNQLIQQMTTVDIGVSGLSKLMQQSIPSAVMSRLSGPNAFR